MMLFWSCIILGKKYMNLELVLTGDLFISRFRFISSDDMAVNIKWKS